MVFMLKNITLYRATPAAKSIDRSPLHLIDPEELASIELADWYR